ALELPRMRGADVCDQGRMVVTAPLTAAVLPVIADIAMGDRVRISSRNRNVRDRTPQARSDQSEVRGEVGSAVRLLRVRRDDVEADGLRALHGGKHLAVGAKLQDRARPGFAGELRVHWFVGIRAKSRRLLESQEDIRDAGKIVIAERRLDDD